MSGVAFQILLGSGGVAGVHRVALGEQGGATSYTVPLGSPTSSRVIVLSVSGAQQPATITIGATALTRRILGTSTSIWSAVIASGTTASMTTTGSAGGFSFEIYAVFRASSAVPTATATSGSINVPANGICIAAAESLTPATPIAWSGLTVDYDVNFLSVARTSAASKEFTAAQSPLAVGMSGAPNQCEAAWGP